MRLKLKVRNNQYDYRDRYANYVHIPEFNTYIGRVVKPAPRWLSENEVMLTTGDHESPVRIIDKRDIKEAWVDRTDRYDGVSLVPGETSSYVVTRGPLNRYSCTCTAFKFRAKCTHVDSVKKGTGACSGA